MVVLVNRAKMTTATTGTGTITLGTAVQGYSSFATAGVSDGDSVRYVIEDGASNWEIGTGTYTASGTTLSRTVIESSAGGSAISLSGDAIVFISAIAADIQPTIYQETSATATGGQTTFSATYTVGLVEVFLNGARLNSTDYTATNGTQVVLASGATAGDIVDIVAYGTVSVANTYTQAAADAKFVDVAGDTMTGALTLSADPTSNLQAATKQYVDTIAAAGIHYHAPVRVEHPSNLTATYDNGASGVGATLTNSGTQAALVLDNVTMVLNDRVLIANQTNQAHNGVYTVTNVGSASTNWVLTRATDADSYGPSDPDALGEGDAFFIKEGDTNAGHLDVMTTSGTITFGTTNIVFSEVAETTVYSAGNGLTLTGTTFAVGAGTGVTVNANDVAIGQSVGTGDTVTFATVNANLTGNVTGNVTGDVTGNADTATAWATSRTVSLTGDVTGSATGVDGSGNVSIATTIAADSVALGTDTTGNYVAAGAVSGNGLSGSASAEGATFTVTSNATNANTASTIVFRDSSGNFSAGTITAALNGNASTATSATDADTVDSLHASQFLRSDTDDSTSGVLTSTSTSGTGGIKVDSSGTAYISADRGSTSYQVGYQWRTAGTTNWWNYISTSSTDLKWYTSSEVMTLTTSGSLSTTPQGTLWGSSNDGSGSGLDADTVDGIQASSFLRSDTTDHAAGRITWPSSDVLETSSSYQSNLEVYQDTSGADAFMSFHVAGDYAAYFGLKGDINDFAVGGWSMGANYYRVWHAGNDGSGSGLDADLLDGVQGSSYLRSDANDTTTGQLTVDNDNGLKVVYGTETTNIYYTGYGMDSHRGTTYIRPSNDNTQTLYIGGSGSANDWANISLKVGNNNNVNINGNTVWNAGNDGSGSGLDADTVDGLQASSFLRSDAADTATGNLTLNGTVTFGSAVDINGQYLDNVEDIYLRDKLFHDGDVDTYLGFGTNTITLATGGSQEVTVTSTGVQLGDTGNGYFQPVSGDYGSIQIDGGAHGGWEGYSIGGRVVFMHDNSSTVGIYDDVSNKWMLNCALNGAVNLYHNNSKKLQTQSWGASVTGVFIADSVAEDYDALSGTTPTCNIDNAGAFSLTMTGNTTFTFSGADSGYSNGFILQLTGNGGTVTWPTSVDWAGGTAPDAPASGETDIYVFWTRDGGTTWYGILSIDAAA